MSRAALLLWLLLVFSTRAHPAVIAVLEAPEEGQAAAGIGVVRGWAFSDTGEVVRVVLWIDGVEFGSIPCCGERADVAAAFSHLPREKTLRSGFGLTLNYGLLPEGPHTLGVEIEENGGGGLTLTHTIEVVKPGGFEFLDLFDLSSATARLAGEELVLSGIRIRDKASQKAVRVKVRWRWFRSLQGWAMVGATTLGPDPDSGGKGEEGKTSQAYLPPLRATLESPQEGQTVSGIGVVRGWAFAQDGRVKAVHLVVDGQELGTIPCCSERADVALAFPQSPQALQSGFGLALNFGLLASGPHTLGVRVVGEEGSSLLLHHPVTAVRPGGFEFVEELDVSGARARVRDQEVVLEGVELRGREGQALRTLHYRWDGALQSLTLVKEEEVLFEEDFEDGAGNWTFLGGVWWVREGELVESSDSGEHSLAVGGPEVGRFQLAARLRSGDDDTLGLIFCFRDPQNFYLAEFVGGKGRVALKERVRGAFRTLAEVEAYPYLEGIPFEAGVRAGSQSLQVFLNGRTVLETEGVECEGRVGFYSRFQKEAAFDRLRLLSLDSLKPLGGNVVYVDAANEGGIEDGLTEETAWSTIGKALRDPRFYGSAGNTVVVRGGVYYEQIDIFSWMSGIPGAWNTIRAADGEEVIIDGEKDTPGARVEGVLVHTGVSYVRIEGLRIRSAQHRGILVLASGPGEIVENQIYSCGDTGVEFWFGAFGYEVARNVIHTNEGDGIVLSQGSGEDPSRFGANEGIRVRNNIIFANGPEGGDGIRVLGDLPHTFALHNNTVVGNRGNGIFVGLGVGGGDVRNNIVAFNSLIGLKDFSGPTTFKGFNNLFGNGASGAKNFDGPGGPGTQSLSADPLFRDASLADFRLGEGSPAIDAGDPNPRFNDTDATRNDMGAYGGPAAFSKAWVPQVP